MFQHSIFTCALSALLLLSACSQSAVSDVNSVLNARDHAISERNITAYAAQINDTYHDRGKNKADIVAYMQKLFEQFSDLKMHSFGRDIFIADENNARAAQSYRLKVLMDGSWRDMLQREELSLTRTDTGWKISAGL
ncbi:MAG: hypothetical protein Q9M25_07525 [Mariprofundaceae bacterium]|nr:hypothetical protein [Mariprofundaceae bacterium]